MKSFIVSLAALMVCGPAIAAPLATIEGIADPVLLDALQAAVGERAETDSPADGPLRQARSAADRARRLLRSEGYYRAQIDPRIDSRSQAVIHITLGPRVRITTIDTSSRFAHTRAPPR